MAWIPKMEHAPAVVALAAAVLDARSGGARPGHAKEVGERVSDVVVHHTADYVTTSAFVSAALAELAAEAIGVTPEEVLATVLEAATTGKGQRFGMKGK